MPLGEVGRCHKCQGLFASPELVMDKSTPLYDYKCRDEHACGLRRGVGGNPVPKDFKKISIPVFYPRDPANGRKVARPPSPWVQVMFWLTTEERDVLYSLFDEVPLSEFVRRKLNEVLLINGKQPLYPRRPFRKRTSRGKGWVTHRRRT